MNNFIINMILLLSVLKKPQTTCLSIQQIKLIPKIAPIKLDILNMAAIEKLRKRSYLVIK